MGHPRLSIHSFQPGGSQQPWEAAWKEHHTQARAWLQASRDTHEERRGACPHLRGLLRSESSVAMVSLGPTTASWDEESLSGTESCVVERRTLRLGCLREGVGDGVAVKGLPECPQLRRSYVEVSAMPLAPAATLTTVVQLSDVGWCGARVGLSRGLWWGRPRCTPKPGLTKLPDLRGKECCSKTVMLQAPRSPVW